MLSEVFFDAMHAGLNRTPAIHSNSILNPIVLEFIKWQLNGSFLEQDFSKLQVIDGNDWALSTTRNQFAKQDFKLAIMFSGGIDSTIGALFAQHEMWYAPSDVALVSVDYGQPYREAEKKAQHKIVERLSGLGFAHISTTMHKPGEVTCPTLDTTKMPQGYIIPMRNAMLAAIGSRFSNNVWLLANYRAPDSGKKENSGVSDKSNEFFDKLGRIISIQHHNDTRVSSPVSHLSKTQTVEWLIQTIGRDYAVEILRDTVTCYGATPEHPACGRCYTCWKTGRMLKKVKIWDELKNKFTNDPFSDPQINQYELREQNKGR